MDLEKLSGVKHISEWLPSLGEELYNRGDEPSLAIRSLPVLNHKIWGLRPAALTVVGARTSQGKSSFALQIAADLSSQRIPVWLLSLEMSVPNLIERLFCHMMSVDNYVILSGKMKSEKEIQRKYLKFKNMLQDSTLLITEGIGKHWEDVTQLIETVGDRPRVIIVDYVQNIAFRSGDTREIINEYIRKFRNMAIKHGFAGVLCSQINRGAEEQKSKEPSLAQLKETGFLEESADMVLLLHWQQFYKKNQLNDPDTSDYEINVAKNRNGRTGVHKLYYTPKYYRFTEDSVIPLEPDYAMAAAGEVDRVSYALDIFGGRIIDPDRERERS